MTDVVRLPLEPDVSWRRPRDRTLLIGGSPLSLLRFSAPAAASLDAIENGVTSTAEDVPEPDVGLVAHLLRRGIIHRRATTVADASRMTVVVPALVRSESDRARLAALVESIAPLRVVVVDDGSPTSIRLPESGCTVVRRADTGGPAAARNAGLAEVTTQITAFVDADCVFGESERASEAEGDVAADTLLSLAGHLDDPDVVVVAPRLASGRGKGMLARYETIATPLDMGPRRALVRRGSRVSHVPAAVMVARTDAVRSVGGFDESLRFGEDVDLLWRLDSPETRCVYDPSFTVHHEPRPSVVAMLRQRFGYGTSAAPLDRRHRCPPYRGHAVVAAGVVSLALGWWQAGLVALVLATSATCLRLGRHGVDIVTAARVSFTGQMASASHLARAATREWLPLTTTAALLSNRAALALFVSWIAPSMALWWRGWRAGRRTDPFSAALLRLLDHAAYSAGVWTGMVRSHSPTAIAPSLRLSL